MPLAQKICGIVAAIALISPSAHAGEYIMTATGSITSGFQASDYFGSNAALTGQALTYSIIFSPGPPETTNYIYFDNGDVEAAYTSQISPKFIVTIGGTTLTFDNGGVDNGSVANLNLYKGHSLPVPYGNADSMYVGGYYNGAGSTFAEGDISAYAFWSPFIQSYDLAVPETDIAQPLDAEIPEADQAYFSYYKPATMDGLQVKFTAALSEVTLSPYTDPISVPEPASAAILGAALFFMALGKCRFYTLRQVPFFPIKG